MGPFIFLGGLIAISLALVDHIQWLSLPIGFVYSPLFWFGYVAILTTATVVKFVRQQEVNHAMKLAWKIKVIVLREIYYIAIFLRDKDLNLLRKTALVSGILKRNKDQFMRPKIPPKQVGVVVRASVEQDPKLDPQAPQRLLERPQASFRQPKLVVTQGKAQCRLCHLGVDSIRDSDVAGDHLSGSMGKRSVRARGLKRRDHAT